MTLNDFHDLYVAELQELRSVEDQLVEALPKMVESARSDQLRGALEEHLSETRSQRDRLDELLRNQKAPAREHTDGSMRAILDETERWAGLVDDETLRDAGLIASAQRVAHYEIAVYGTLVTWAKHQRLKDDARTLETMLEEHKAADARLTEIAERLVNPEAVA